MRVVWDRRKAAANRRKYGVSFDEVSSVFDDRHGAYYPDSRYEDRFVLIAASSEPRELFAVHAEVEENAIRILSARKATRNEKTRYEKD